MSAPLKPKNVTATDTTAFVDGCSCGILSYYRWSEDWYDHVLTGAFVVEDREAWDRAHPGVEPTSEAMRQLFHTAGNAISMSLTNYFAGWRRRRETVDCDDRRLA